PAQCAGARSPRPHCGGAYLVRNRQAAAPQPEECGHLPRPRHGQAGPETPLRARALRAPRRPPENRVGVLPTAARLYFPTRFGESSRQTAALLLATLPYSRSIRVRVQSTRRDTMTKHTTFAGIPALLTAALLAAACHDSISSDRSGLAVPMFDVVGP